MDSRKNQRIGFYFVWLSTLLIQALFVELQGDEAYYWRYSLEPAWGYFDHPPVTAFLVKMGYALVPNELGVRLFFIVLSTLTVWVVERLIDPLNLKLYYAIVLSVAFLQIGLVFGGGMYALPDFPLIFFTAIFFLLYKMYLEKDTLPLVLALSLTIALMLLSKYHGILVVGFTVLSNLKLLRRMSFWVIVFLASICFAPHLWWQYANDFPSVNYHLFDRSTQDYQFSFTAEYVFGQLFVLGPFIGLLLIYLGFTCKPRDLFDRSLKFVVVGTYVFFLIMSFRGRVEGNWTIITLVPLIILGYHQIADSAKLRRITFVTFSVSITIILLARICVVGKFLPDNFRFVRALSVKADINEIANKFGPVPVAFMNSYQRAAQYEFYSGIPAFSLNNVHSRKNQYSIWDTENKYQGKTVAVVFNFAYSILDSVRLSGDYFPFFIAENFRSSSNITITMDDLSTLSVRPNDAITVKTGFRIINGHVRDLEANPEMKSYVGYAFFQNALAVTTVVSELRITDSMINDGLYYDVKIFAPPAAGEYYMYMCVVTGLLPHGINSTKVKVIVK